nr:hypothetical protein [Tanacetum cinerariifolium]
MGPEAYLGVKKEWGLSPKAKVRVLHTAQLDVTGFSGWPPRFFRGLGRGCLARGGLEFKSHPRLLPLQDLNDDSNLEVVKGGMVPFVTVAYGNTHRDLNDDPVAMEVQSSLADQTNMVKIGGFIRNHPIILRKWNPNVDLLKEDVGNVSVWVKLNGVPVTEFSEDGLSVNATKLDTPLMLDSYTFDMCLQSWGRSSYARVMIDLQADVELKDNIVVFGHTQEECPKNIGLGVAKNLKKPCQNSRGVPVGQKVGFKPHKEYRIVSKKPTASPSGNKNKSVAHTNEVSNSNSFDVLNSVDNDVELCINWETKNLVNNGANSSGTSFMTIKNSSTSSTPIVDKIEKFQDLLINRKAILVDEVGNLLKNVECPGDYDREDGVASFDNDMAHSLASERLDFGTQSFSKQLRDSYSNGDYDEDPYDDDMYEGQNLPQEFQDISDNLDIRVRGRKKK